MFRRNALVCLVFLTTLVCAAVVTPTPTEAAGIGQPHDWNRFYYYPYVYYPQNFWSSEYYQSSDDLYYRYPQEMRVPVYNKQWHNMYPEGALYHRGHHFLIDTF